ncbi:MAG: hypothetical protein M3R24_04645 [Chloroflexota bacterium]|nr:hypothetical protein [Chloroflexota bacterium]
MSELIDAILKGDERRVRTLAETRPDLLYVRSFTGLFPVALARKAGRASMVVALLRAHAPDSEDPTNYPSLLIDYLSELSGTLWCAGWLADIEFIMWHSLVTGESPLGDLIEATALAETHADLRFLVEQCNGWVLDHDDGARVIPLTEWTDHFKAWAASRG